MVVRMDDNGMYSMLVEFEMSCMFACSVCTACNVCDVYNGYNATNVFNGFNVMYVLLSMECKTSDVKCKMHRAM